MSASFLVHLFICCAVFDVKTFQSYVEEAANSSENIFHQSPLKKHQLLKNEKMTIFFSRARYLSKNYELNIGWQFAQPAAA